jgi:hypothetical protein
MKINCLIISLILLISCKTHRIKETKDIRFKDWTSINITVNEMEINIFNNSDSLFYKSWSYKDTMINNLPVMRSTNFKKKKIYIDKMDRDSIFGYVFDLIRNPVFTGENINDGDDLKLAIKYKGFSIGCYYWSIGQWNSFSMKANNIKRILDQRIKITAANTVYNP